MSKIKSITRFPGGKSRSLKFLNEFLELSHDSYREPFIGGCTVFLSKDKAKINWINDLDYDIYAMHISIRDNPDKMIDYIKQYTQPTLESYNQVQNDKTDDIIWRGFRTLFLNRCSFNGMIFGGPIGGKNQTGKWLVDCCWKKETLIERVKSIHEKLKDVKITNLDFEELIKEPGDNVLIYMDPPYIFEGNALYAVGMSLDDHKRLRDLLAVTPHDFLLSYRDCDEVRELYKNKDKFVILERTWTYSMMTQSKEGCQPSNEVFIMNHELHNKYLNKKEQKKLEQQKIKKITLVRTINNENGLPEGSCVNVKKEYKNFYKGTHTIIGYSSGVLDNEVKVKKKNCKIVEYEQNGIVINLEKNTENIIGYDINAECENCNYLINYVDKNYWPDSCEKCGKIYNIKDNNLEETDCEECHYQINYMGENKWSDICGKCGIDMSKYKGLMEINLINNNNKNNKTMKTNDIELEKYEFTGDETPEELEDLKQIKKINQEIDNVLIEEDTNDEKGNF